MNSIARIILIIGIILLIFQVLINSIFGIAFANNSIIYIYAIIAIIIFGWFLDLIRKDISTGYLKEKFLKPTHFIVLMVGIILGMIGYLTMEEIGCCTLVIVYYFLLSVIYIFEIRISVAITITLLGFAFIALLLKDTPLAKDFSVYAFYFLIITITTNLRENLTN